MSGEQDIFTSLQIVSGVGGEVCNYEFSAEDNSFSATIRTRSSDHYSDDKDVTFYSNWCTQWIESFSQQTATNWIVRYTYPRPQKCHFRKVFKCQHTNFDKVKKRKREATRQRDRECNAKISILFKKINRNTIRNDILLRRGLDVQIEITFRHSHKVAVAEAYSYLRMSSDTQAIFLKYFEDGMTASAARTFHEIYLENMETDEAQVSVILANAQIIPTERQVEHLYTRWREDNFGGRGHSDVLAVLRKKQGIYAEAGTKIVIQENPLIVVILTAIMLRAHRHNFAHEMVFVDSSGSCDQTNTSVTFLFAATKVGAVPLACILHTEQSEENYTAAFELLRNSLSTESFGGFGFPKILMTDDSCAERNALKQVFPESNRLLCIFHVCQAMWRWLWHSNHGILKEDRRHLMTLFRRVLYGTSIEEMRDNYDNLLGDQTLQKYDNLRSHIANYWERREEWSFAYRSSILTRGNNTNNYVEASIRIFKDIVLQRCKAFNACALVDFIANIFESYHRRHLLSFANFRSNKNEIALKKMTRCTKLSVQKVDENTFLVSSEADDKLFYTAYVDIAFCDCVYGQGGRFCKHLCAIQNKFGLTFSNCILLNKDDRKELAEIALGENVSHQFYDNMSACAEPTNSSSGQVVQENGDIPVAHTSGFCDNTTEIDLSVEHGIALAELCQHFKRLTDVASKYVTTDMTNATIKLNKTLSKIVTPLDLINFFHTSKNVTRKRKIPVQPTSVSRRKVRPGLTSGARRIQAGRPSKHEKQTIRKRQRSLQVNIAMNRPNAKSHGNAH